MKASPFEWCESLDRPDITGVPSGRMMYNVFNCRFRNRVNRCLVFTGNCNGPDDSISRGFLWEATENGHRFWYTLARQLRY